MKSDMGGLVTVGVIISMQYMVNKQRYSVDGWLCSVGFSYPFGRIPEVMPSRHAGLQLARLGPGHCSYPKQRKELVQTIDLTREKQFPPIQLRYLGGET